MEYQVLMPKLGEEMKEGTIVQWLKKVGDKVKKWEPLLLVETGKATVEAESEVDGTLKKILVAENTEHIPIGQVIAIIEKEG